NSMAPTVVGWHWAGVCPHCQGLLIVPALPPEPNEPFVLERAELGICTLCRRTSVSEPGSSSVEKPDRIMVNKLLKPQRWDLVSFRHPTQPSAKYIDRLVGLPGETVYIKEGTIWINDVKIELPAELAGLRYTTEIDHWPVTMGTPENPWRLGPDEYCALGD